MTPLRTSAVAALLIVALCLPAGAAPAKVAIQGKVTDEQGQPLPGVIVIARSRRGGSGETTTTNWNGFYQLRVHPGAYMVSFELSGMNAKRRAVHVRPGIPIAVDVTMDFTLVAEVIEVTAAPTETGTGAGTTIPANPAADSLARMFVRAAEAGILGSLPLVPFLPETTLDGSTVPSSVAAGGDSGEGIRILSAGIPAEHGGGTGGAVVLVPEAEGANDLSGEVRGLYEAEAWRGDEKPVAPPFAIQRWRSDRDVAAQAGGPLIEDRLWFFARLRRVAWQSENESSTRNTVGRAEGQDEVGYLTVSAEPASWLDVRNRLFLSRSESAGLIGDYARRRHGDAAALTNVREVDEWWDTISASVTMGKFSLSAAADGGVRRDAFDTSLAAPAVQQRDVAAALFERDSPGFLLDQLRRRSTGLSARAAYWIATHDINAGAAAARKDLDVQARLGGARIVDLAGATPLFERFITAGGLPAAERVETVSRRDENVYLQDAFRIGQRFSFNAGARWERLEAAGPLVTAAPDAVLPRVAGAVDLFANGRSRVLASWSAYQEELSDEEVLGLLSGYGAGMRTSGGIARDFAPATAVDAGLRPRVTDEVATTWSQTIRRHGYLSATVSRRRLRSDIVRASCGAFVCIGNPSHGLQRTIERADGTGLEPVPRPERSLHTIQIEAGHRHREHALGLIYTRTRAEGNVEPRMFPQGPLPVDPFLDARRAFADFNAAGAIGPLHADREHHVAVNGSHRFGYLRLSYSGFWMSGTPLSRYGYSDRFGDYLYVLGERGSNGRTPSAGELNAAVEYVLPFDRFWVTLQLTASNLLDAQKPLLVDERWSFRETDNDSPAPTNPHYGQPLLRTPPRQFGLGLRFEF